MRRGGPTPAPHANQSGHTTTSRSFHLVYYLGSDFISTMETLQINKCNFCKIICMFYMNCRWLSIFCLPEGLHHSAKFFTELATGKRLGDVGADFGGMRFLQKVRLGLSG